MKTTCVAARIGGIALPRILDGVPMQKGYGDSPRSDVIPVRNELVYKCALTGYWFTVDAASTQCRLAE